DCAFGADDISRDNLAVICFEIVGSCSTALISRLNLHLRPPDPAVAHWSGLAPPASLRPKASKEMALHGFCKPPSVANTGDRSRSAKPSLRDLVLPRPTGCGSDTNQHG